MAMSLKGIVLFFGGKTITCQELDEEIDHSHVWSVNMKLHPGDSYFRLA